jgi:hypothetical protein
MPEMEDLFPESAGACARAGTRADKKTMVRIGNSERVIDAEANQILVVIPREII